LRSLRSRSKSPNPRANNDSRRILCPLPRTHAEPLRELSRRTPGSSKDTPIRQRSLCLRPNCGVAQLDAYEAQLVAAVESKPLAPETEWIFLAVADTIDQTGAPLSLFTDLLSAFKQDCVTLRYARFSDVQDYCRRSANPIGRLVLILHGHRDDRFFEWSDAICTALQLANFWQDVGVDIRKDGRIYIPEEDWAAYAVTREMFDRESTSPELRACIQAQVERTQTFFDRGRSLPGCLPFPLRLEIRLTWLGGNAILDKIRSLEFDTLVRRPKIGTGDKIRLLAKALVDR